MRRIFGLGLLLTLSSPALFAAGNSHTFYLPTDVRAGNAQIPRGIVEMTWSDVSGSEAQLTIKTENKKTITIPARVVEGKQEGSGVVTSVVNGVTYLDELRTKNAKFIFRHPSKDSR